MFTIENLKRFRDDQRGTASIELLFVVPILVWALLSTFVYFDAFRTEANVNRAALTIADMLSREQGEIGPDYLDRTQKLLRTLTFSDSNPDFRVSVYFFEVDPNSGNGEYKIYWSEDMGMGADLTTADLAVLDSAGRLPILGDGAAAILVETRTDYTPPMRVGIGMFSGTNLDSVVFDTFVVTRSRFADALCWEGLLPCDRTTAGT